MLIGASVRCMSHQMLFEATDGSLSWPLGHEALRGLLIIVFRGLPGRFKQNGVRRSWAVECDYLISGFMIGLSSHEGARSKVDTKIILRLRTHDDERINRTSGYPYQILFPSLSL